MNYDSFCELIGRENVTVINLMDQYKPSLKYTLLKRVYSLFGFNEGLNWKRISEIVKISREHNYVFIDL